MQDGFWMGNMFRGYDAVTLAVVANLAFSGVLHKIFKIGLLRIN